MPKILVRLKESVVYAFQNAKCSQGAHRSVHFRSQLFYSSRRGGGPLGCTIFYSLLVDWKANKSKRILRTYANELGSCFRLGLVLGQRHERQQRRMANDGRVRITLDICTPFPAVCVRVSCANVFGLQALEFLLRAKLVGLRRKLVAKG